jgi:pimeloyl-ACP methyl ester carboxylesterase
MTTKNTIGYHAYGKGSIKVLVFHGWFGDSRAFDPMLQAIDETKYTYAFIDQRGYGASKDLAGPHTLEQVADDGVALADSLGWRQFHVLGHSMGGAVAQRLITRAAARVKSFVGLSAVPASGFPFDEPTHALFYGAVESDANCRGILDFTTGNRLSSAWLDFMVARTRATCTREAFAGYLPAWEKASFVDELKGSKVPMLALVGEHDPALGAALMKAAVLGLYADATLEVIANAGHYAMQETPVYLATALDRFFSRRDAA